MFENFTSWMFQPGQYNDLVVYMVLFITLLLVGMIFNKE